MPEELLEAAQPRRPGGYVKERIAAFGEAGVTNLNVIPVGEDPRGDRAPAQGMGVLTFDLQAHRGGAGLRPENSLVAFAHALELGVSTLELDVQITQDRRPVLSHDRVLPDGEFIVLAAARLALAADPRPGLRGCSTCTVRSTCGSTWRRSSTSSHPDEVAPRERFVDVVVEEVRRAGLVGSGLGAELRLGRPGPGSRSGARTRAQRAHQRRLPGGRARRVLHPGWPEWTSTTSPAGSWPPPRVAATRRSRRSHASGRRPSACAAAHAADLAVIPYTVDDADLFARLVGLDVDGAITNRPDIGRAVLAELGHPLPTRYPRGTDDQSVSTGG